MTVLSVLLLQFISIKLDYVGISQNVGPHDHLEVIYRPPKENAEFQVYLS